MTGNTSLSETIVDGCQFELWDKDTKSMSSCNKPSFIHIEEAGYCREHYVDAVMHLQSSDPDWIIPREVAKALIVKEPIDG